ncbi:hypothetical protein [Natronospora cellulosivora (SeqCode)]
MNFLTLYWMIFTLTWFVILSIAVPRKKIIELLPYGFFLGFIHSIVLNYFTVHHFKVWILQGEIFIFGIPLFTSLAWISPVIIFSYYYPFNKQRSLQISYILLFAAGIAMVNYFLSLANMWEINNWRFIYTFILAIFTHTIMVLFFPVFNVESDKTNI